MSNEIFVKRSITELPPKADWYTVYDGSKFLGQDWFDGNNFQHKPATHWLEPESITIEQYLSEHPEIVEKIFEAARDKMFAEEGYVQHYRYPTAKDYIDSIDYE